MKLLLSQNLDGYHTTCDSPTADEIRKHIETLDWQSLSGAKIEIDPIRWIEMSGSDNDGYSIIYSDSENEWISKEVPEDRDHCITTLTHQSMSETVDSAWWPVAAFVQSIGFSIIYLIVAWVLRWTIYSQPKGPNQSIEEQPIQPPRD